ncbi:unnamed protein product [Pseudo-nitzschia multistriata]|uniref:Plastocyanin-like domain-containing protein n=1 Tax=Pseudo-nitzschia multistriata TaxID=183589 RepID=A0A448ZQY4_9STRA|nr:unnamed protein product [Pseudo-nitzschia multistriata]
MINNNENKYGSLVDADRDTDSYDDDEKDALRMESQRLITHDDESSFLKNKERAPGNAGKEKRNKSSVSLVKFFLVIVVGTLCFYFLGSDRFSDKDISSFVDGLQATISVFPNQEESETITHGNDIDDTIAYSPFFEHVLEWKQLDMADSSQDEDDDDGSSKRSSNHYHASIEFCSDPKRGLYAYGPVGNCVPGTPAPLIKMKPKHFYHLTLVNNAHIDTNVHTHGLHVSGVGSVDDVTRVAEPGKCLTYEYYILDDADVGTFWYHPHRHPLVTRSAYGGAYGMIIVEETVKNYYPEHLENFLTNNKVLLQFSSMYNKKLPDSFRSNRVNGQKGLDLSLSPDTPYYFQVSSVVYAESVNYLEFDPPDACDVRVVAYDGVYRSEIPGPTSIHKQMMTVSSRGDFAVSCSRDADIHFHQGKMSEESNLVRIHVPSSLSSSSTDKEASSNFTHVSLEAILPSSPYWDPALKTTWKPRRPYYMPNLNSPQQIVDEYWHVSMDDWFVNGTKGVSVNQHTWDPAVAIRTFDLGQLVEFPILLSQSHPYHAHINRMQVVEPGGCGLRFEEGEYFDTIVQSKDKKKCTVRVKFFDFAGRLVIHCHRFGHEDQGMMTVSTI